MTTKKARSNGDDDLRREYDLSKLAHPVRGKYQERAMADSNLVLLDPDVAQAFPNVEAINDALRMLVNVARTTVRTTGRPGRRSA